ncbi:MAG: hypothetical protein ACOZBW_03400 [Thermodesulfobacteriota bacterium]
MTNVVPRAKDVIPEKAGIHLLIDFDSDPDPDFDFDIKAKENN